MKQVGIGGAIPMTILSLVMIAAITLIWNYNPKKVSEDQIRASITKVGYHADWMPRDSTAYENLPNCCKDGAHGTPIPQVPLKPNNENDEN